MIPSDLAKPIGDLATGWELDAVDDGKDPAAKDMGREGGPGRKAAKTLSQWAQRRRTTQRSRGARTRATET